MRWRAWQLSARVVAAIVALVASAKAKAALPPLPEDFVTQTGGWLSLEYFPEARAKIPTILDIADSARTDLMAALGRPVLWQARARVARDPIELASLLPGPSPDGESAAHPDFELVVLALETATGAEADLERLLRRELSRLALHEATLGNDSPRWFASGFADSMAKEPVLSAKALLFASTTIRGKLLPLSGLDQALDRRSSASLAAAQARDFVQFLQKKSPAAFFNLIESLRRAEPFLAALEGAYGEPIHVLEHEWRDRAVLRQGYLPVFAVIGFIGASAFGISAWRSSRRKRKQRPEPEPDSITPDAPEEEAPQPSGRVRLVLRRRSGDSRPTVIDLDVPKVEHGGKWHTLH